MKSQIKALKVSLEVLWTNVYLKNFLQTCVEKFCSGFPPGNVQELLLGIYIDITRHCLSYSFKNPSKYCSSHFFNNLWKILWYFYLDNLKQLLQESLKIPGDISDGSVGTISLKKIYMSFRGFSEWIFKAFSKELLNEFEKWSRQASAKV